MTRSASRPRSSRASSGSRGCRRRSPTMRYAPNISPPESRLAPISTAGLIGSVSSAVSVVHALERSAEVIGVDPVALGLVLVVVADLHRIEDELVAVFARVGVVDEPVFAAHR